MIACDTHVVLTYVRVDTQSAAARTHQPGGNIRLLVLCKEETITFDLFQGEELPLKWCPCLWQDNPLGVSGIGWGAYFSRNKYQAKKAFIFVWGNASA